MQRAILMRSHTHPIEEAMQMIMVFHFPEAFSIYPGSGENTKPEASSVAFGEVMGSAIVLNPDRQIGGLLVG